jgi:hypothetical protein
MVDLVYFLQEHFKQIILLRHIQETYFYKTNIHLHKTWIR